MTALSCTECMKQNVWNTNAKWLYIPVSAKTLSFCIDCECVKPMSETFIKLHTQTHPPTDVQYHPLVDILAARYFVLLMSTFTLNPYINGLRCWKPRSINSLPFPQPPCTRTANYVWMQSASCSAFDIPTREICSPGRQTFALWRVVSSRRTCLARAAC